VDKEWVAKFKDRLGNNRLELYCEINVRGESFDPNEPPSWELQRRMGELTRRFGQDFPNVEIIVSREMGGVDIKMLAVGIYTTRDNLLDFFRERLEWLLEQMQAMDAAYNFNVKCHGGFKNTEVKQRFEYTNEGSKVTYRITKSTKQSPLPRIFNHKVRLALLVLVIGAWLAFEKYSYVVYGQYRDPIATLIEFFE